MYVFEELLINVFWIIAELESFFSKFPSYSIFRRIQLKLMRVKHQKHIWFGHNITILNGKNIIVGDYCAIGHNSVLSAHGPIIIGDNFTGSNGLNINSGSHNPETYKPFAASVIIGNRVWVGLNVTILAGVKIGNDVVIGAGSLVNKDVPSNSVAVGVPTRIIRKLNRKDLNEYYKYAKWT